MDKTNPWTGKSSAEDLEIEQAEHRLSDPGSANMQFLQSTLTGGGIEASGFGAGATPWTPPSKSNSANAPQSAGFSGLAPAFSGVGLVGALAGTDLSGQATALGISSAVASAAPAAMGKTTVGEGAALAALGPKALVPNLMTERFSDSLPLMRANNDAQVPLSPEYAQLMAVLGAPVDGPQGDSLQNLLMGVGAGTSAQNLEDAINAVMDQISLINSVFEPVMDGLSGDVQSQVSLMNNMPSTDLGLNILSDASNISGNLTDLLGSLDVGNNPQIGSLLNLGAGLEEVLSVVDSLPILDVITNPITDPIIEPITDIVGGITDPITDPIIDPVIDVVGGVPGLGLLSGLSTSGSSEGDVGLLDGLSSGIASTAGSEGGALDGVLGALDPNKPA
ncbi:MAG TPA: hypothetical protein VFV57_06635 [Limnobacter sp.]|nr:hypothetical protein [Limnobacter sp.]